MFEINFERFLSRGLSVRLSRELDLAGLRMSVNKMLTIMILPALAILILVLFGLIKAGIAVYVDPFIGIALAAFYVIAVYFMIEYRITQRKTKLEDMLPDFLQIAAANLRSGISLERALLLAARPEFGFLSEDIKEMNRRIFSGETLENSLKEFAARYRSLQLQHAIRIMMENLRYGGSMADIIQGIAKDIRGQQLIQKEIAGQLFLYTIFIVFAALIAAPVLYGLTSQMINVTANVWKGISQSNPGGLPSAGISFLRPTPPQITPQAYQYFSYIAILIISGFASLIMGAISTGSAIRGIRYTPLFVIVGLVIYYIVSKVLAQFFAGITSV